MNTNVQSEFGKAVVRDHQNVFTSAAELLWRMRQAAGAILKSCMDANFCTGIFPPILPAEHPL